MLETPPYVIAIVFFFFLIITLGFEKVKLPLLSIHLDDICTRNHLKICSEYTGVEL